MKLLFFTFIFILSNQTFAETHSPKEWVCLMNNAQSTHNDYSSRNENDKFKHCGLSCVLAYKCGIKSSASLGILKEILDLFTPGDSDIEDLKANKYGIDLVLKHNVRDQKTCDQKCKSRYF
jgi:hypothetical protein